MFLDAALHARKAFFQFEWVSWFCFGIYWLIYFPRQEGESLRAFFKKPQAIASAAFLTAAVVGFGYSLLSIR
jgi:hypothetical protein